MESSLSCLTCFPSPFGSSFTSSFGDGEFVRSIISGSYSSSFASPSSLSVNTDRGIAGFETALRSTPEILGDLTCFFVSFLNLPIC